MVNKSSGIKRFLSKVKRCVTSFFSNAITFFTNKFNLSPVYCKTSWSALQEWKYEVKRNSNIIHNGKTIILVAIRNSTWIEWAIFAAYKFYIMGYKPVVYYSLQDVIKTYPHPRWLLFNFWQSALKSSFIEFIDIDKLAKGQIPDNSKYNEIAKDLAHTMAAYNLRVEEYELDIFHEEYQKEYQKSYDLLLRYCDEVEKSITKYKESRIICPNGLIEKSVIFYALSLKMKVNIFFIEGWARRLGHMIWSDNKPVMFYDIEGWSKVVGAWDDKKESDFKAMLNFQNLTEVSDNDWFKGFIPVQRATKNALLPDDFKQFIAKSGITFLAGTNVIGDSATLRRSRIFKNQKDWLNQLIPFFGKNPNLKLIIRIHPDEVLPKAVVKLGEIIAGMVAKYPNIYLFKADHDVNTNALIQQADVGLAWVSNIGVDMVLQGKPTIIAGKSNYMDLNIGIYPDTQQSYFEQIIKLSAKADLPDNEMVERAKIYQRIVFKEMSLDATSNSYDAKDYRINHLNEPKDQTKFFKILSGELDSFGQQKV